MTDDDAITPDRLRLAGWGDNRAGEFVRDGMRPFCVATGVAGWYWVDGLKPLLPAKLAGMADVAARLAAAGGGGS